MAGLQRPIPVILAAVALVAGGCQRPPASPQQRIFLALADQPAGRLRGPYCYRNGPREWRHGFRATTLCLAYYDDGHAEWVRRADGVLMRAGRSWLLWQGETTRYGLVRDSVTAAMAALAGGAAPCVANQPYGNGGRLTAWAVADYDATVIQFEIVPGGPPAYRLDAGLVREHPLCHGSRRPAA